MNTQEYKINLKKNFKHMLITALIITPSLMIMLLSSIYHLAEESMERAIVTEISLILSVLSICALLASTVLALVYKRKSILIFFSVLFVLCFICYLIFIISGNTDLLTDGFFQMTMLVLVLPAWSFMSLAMELSSFPATPVLIIIGFLAAANIASITFLIYKSKKKKSGSRWKK